MTDQWKTATRPTETGSHIGMVFDRSPQGLDGAEALLKEFPGVDVRLEPWKDSQDEFFVFILDMESRWAGLLTARDLNALLSEVLPKIFRLIEAAPALPSFAVAVQDESKHQAISEAIDRLTAPSREQILLNEGNYELAEGRSRGSAGPHCSAVAG